MEKLCEWYRDLHSFAMACALTHYCLTFTRQNLYLEFLTPPLYSSKSSWSEHLEFPGTNGLCLTRLDRQQCSEWTPTNPYRGGRQTYQALIWNQIDKLQTCNEAKKNLQTICFRHSLQSLSRSRRTLITKNKQEITPTHLAAWTLIQSNCPSGPIHDSCGT